MLRTAETAAGWGRLRRVMTRGVSAAGKWEEEISLDCSKRDML